MKLTVLGPWGQSYAGPTTSFYAQFDDVGLLLDTGIDPIGRMRALDLAPTDCTHVYLSHMHSDHSSGFANFVFTRGLLGRSLERKMAPLIVLGDSTVIDSCERLLALQYPDRSFDIAWEALDVGAPFLAADDLSLTTTETVHSVPCKGCRIEASVGGIGFTADTAPSDSHRAFFADCAVLVGEAFGIEAQVGRNVNDRGHSSAEDLGRLVSECRPHTVIPFHFGLECQDPEERRLLLEAARGRSSAHVLDPVASPQLTLE